MGKLAETTGVGDELRVEGLGQGAIVGPAVMASEVTLGGRSFAEDTIQ